MLACPLLILNLLLLSFLKGIQAQSEHHQQQEGLGWQHHQDASLGRGLHGGDGGLYFLFSRYAQIYYQHNVAQPDVGFEEETAPFPKL